MEEGIRKENADVSNLLIFSYLIFHLRSSAVKKSNRIHLSNRLIPIDKVR
jgi:hypothetical protein